MEEMNTTTKVNSKYERVVARIGYYLKSNNIPRILNSKCASFGGSSDEGRIELFSNSLEHMGSLVEHEGGIYCLCALPNKTLASGSYGMTIKIWDIENRGIMCTLYGHASWVTALCGVREGVLVSGSKDKSLIIWSKSGPHTYIYSPRQTLTGHTSRIIGIIRLNNVEIISGEEQRDLRIWSIDQGLCLIHIPQMGLYVNISQMKQHMGGEIAISYLTHVSVWGAVNNWADPIKYFAFSMGESIEFLSGDILLRGGLDGKLEFIDYAQTGCQLPSTIRRLHSTTITAIQRLATNIVVTASHDGYLKVIDPISRVAYLTFKKGYPWMKALAYFY